MTNSRKPASCGMHVLRIELAEIRPPIWRDLLVPSDATLATLHRSIQAAMPWTDCHLHLFEVGKSQFSDPAFESSHRPEGDERRFTLSDVLPHEGARLRYVYDFGDDWVHHVVVREIRRDASGSIKCLDGARAAPPEDCGSTGGYERLVLALRHPNHQDAAELCRWVSGVRREMAAEDARFRGPYDPEAFDLAATNRALARVRAIRWRI